MDTPPPSAVRSAFEACRSAAEAMAKIMHGLAERGKGGGGGEFSQRRVGLWRKGSLGHADPPGVFRAGAPARAVRGEAGRGGSGMSGLIWSTREENPPPSTPLSSSATAHTRLCSYSDLIRPSPTSFWTRISSCCREMTHSPYRIFYSRRLRRNR